jgi:HNH endonuclease
VNTVPPHTQDGNPPQKRCTGPCGRLFPATTEFFHRNAGRLRNACKTCRNDKSKEDYHTSPVHERKLAGEKTKYQLPEVREHKLTRQRAKYQLPEVQERKHAWLQNYRSLPGIRERSLERQRAYDKVRRSSPAGQARKRADQALRRARKRAVLGTHTAAQIQEQLNRQHYRCYYAACGFAKFKRIKENGTWKYLFHVDHTYPLSRVTGTAIPANDISYLVLACPKCNEEKADKFPWEWVAGGRLL